MAVGLLWYRYSLNDFSDDQHFASYSRHSSTGGCGVVGQYPHDRRADHVFPHRVPLHYRREVTCYLLGNFLCCRVLARRRARRRSYVTPTEITPLSLSLRRGRRSGTLVPETEHSSFYQRYLPPYFCIFVTLLPTIGDVCNHYKFVVVGRAARIYQPGWSNDHDGAGYSPPVRAKFNTNNDAGRIPIFSQTVDPG